MTRRALVVVALALLTFAGVSSANANANANANARGQHVNTTVHAADDVAISLDLKSFGPAVLKPGEELATTATVANTSALPMPGLTVTLSVTESRIATSDGLQLFLADPKAAATRVVVSRPANDSGVSVSGAGNILPAGGIVSVDLVGTAAAMGLRPHTAGVYGIVISVTGPAGILATRTAAVTWYDAAITPLRIALLATASGTAEQVQSVASAAAVPGAALAIDPVTVTDATQASELTAGREVFGLPSGNPDLTSLAHSEDLTLLSFALSDAAKNTAPALQGLPWLATIPAVDAPTISLAVARGAEAGVLDVTGGATIAADGPVVDVSAGGETLPVLVPDEQLSTILATYRPGAPDAAARLVAEAALEAQHGDGVTPVVVAPGESWQIATPGLSPSVSELLGAPWVVPVSVRSVIDGTARGTYSAPDNVGTDQDLAPDLIKALARQLDDMGQLSQTTEEPNTIFLPGGRTLLAPLAVDLRADPGTRLTTYQATRDSANATLSSLFVAVGSNVNLIATSGNVPVTLHNDLAVDSTVTVVLKSSSPNLVVEDRPTVTIPAGGDKTAHVAVTGVKSANVTATVALENADGDVVAAPQLLRVRVRADWGNAVTAVFTVGLSLLLIAGLIRTVRRGRGSTRMAPIPAAPRQQEQPPADDTDARGDDG